MSRLDSFIRRLEAQRACLGHAATLIEGLPGPVLELGLGNGRTFDHLRALLPDRTILVFDRQVAAHPDCVPDPANLLLGDIHETLPAARARVGTGAALAHTDLGTGDAAGNMCLAAWLSEALPPLLAPGAVVIADQAMSDARLRPLPLPSDIAHGRYFMYQRER